MVDSIHYHLRFGDKFLVGSTPTNTNMEHIKKQRGEKPNQEEEIIFSKPSKY